MQNSNLNMVDPECGAKEKSKHVRAAIISIGFRFSIVHTPNLDI